MSAEMNDIERRLKAIEAAIKELTETDLFIARQIGGVVAPLEMNIALRTMLGEDKTRFKKLFEEKFEALKPKLLKAKTIAEAFEIMGNFDREIGEYIRAEKVNTADKAMDIAHSFIKKYVPVALPLKAEKKGAEWLVDIDVGALAVKVAKVKVDARTGDIISYEIPEKESKDINKNAETDGKA